MLTGSQNVLLAKDVYPQLTGNVLVQTSPSAAYDTQKTIKHAQKLVALFEANGIPRCVGSHSAGYVTVIRTQAARLY